MFLNKVLNTVLVNIALYKTVSHSIRMLQIRSVIFSHVKLSKMKIIRTFEYLVHFKQHRNGT